MRNVIGRVLGMAWLLIGLSGTNLAGTFGSIVQIRGEVSDIALDQGRGVVYAATFTANRIGMITSMKASAREMSVPRQKLGPDYQNFDPSLDTKFQFVSSGDVYWGQWVKVPVILGVPALWDGTGDYPLAEVEVFAVDRPDGFDGGILGIGLAIGGLAVRADEMIPLEGIGF
jgi:hypothetical protein